jgi:hypothetical protein
MGQAHGFGEDDDMGIFLDSEEASSGDPALAEDLELEGYVAPLRSGGSDGDGLAIPDIEDTGVLDPPPAVTTRNFVCMAGPCRHYTENAVLRTQGPGPDAEESIELERWCGRLRTWAEQTDLTELEVFGCSCYEPDPTGDLDEVRVAVTQTAAQIASVRRRGLEVGARYGICAVGPCEDFIEIVGRKPQDRAGPTKSFRYCTRLAGLGRLRSLLEEPVVACSGWKPRTHSEKVAAMAANNLARLAKYRKVFASRKESTDDHRDDARSRPSDAPSASAPAPAGAGDDRADG